MTSSTPRATLCTSPNLYNAYLLDQGALPTIRRMMNNGMAVDMGRLRELESTLEKKTKVLEGQILDLIPASALEHFVEADEKLADGLDFNFNPNSAEQVGKLLFQVLNLGAGRDLKKTKSGRVSTGKKQLEELREDHPIIEPLLEYRESKKLLTTYARPLQTMAVWHCKGICGVCGRTHWDGHWRIHTQILSTRTGTGRYAQKNPNLQNIPIRTKEGALIRSCFVASPGMVLVDSDYSQIELRTLAHLACERVMIEVFKQGGDLHTKTATQAFGLDVSEVDPILHRLPSKTVNFGVVYGMSGPALFVQLVFMLNQAIKQAKKEEDRQRARVMKAGLTLDWCKDFIDDKFFGTYPDVRPFMDEQVYRARTYGYTWDLGGRTRFIPEMRSCHKWIRGAGERQAGNTPIQGGATVFIKLAAYDLQQIYEDWRDCGVEVEPVNTIHDQLLHETAEDNAEAVSGTVKETMEGVAQIRVPIIADSKVVWRDDGGSGESRWSK